MAVRGSVEIKLSLEQQNRMLAQYKKVEKQIKKNNDSIEKSFNSVREQAKKNEDGITRMVSGYQKLIPVIAGAAASLYGAKKAFDFSREFAKFEQSSRAMEMQFGHSADAVIAKLDEVAKGTISSADLVSAANRAMALNVTRDVDKMAKLLEIARVRGQAMGLDTTQAFSDLVTGIGRASPLILDNLGIITKGWDKQAKAAGKAMDAQFILSKVLSDGSEMLEKTGDVAVTNAEKFQIMESRMKDLKIELGEKLLPVVLNVTESFNNMLGTMLGSNKGDMTLPVMEKGKKQLQEYMKVLDEAGKGGYIRSGVGVDVGSMHQLDKISENYKRLNQEMAERYPIENAKESLELITKISETIKQATPTPGTKRFEPLMKKEEEKKKKKDDIKESVTSVDFQKVMQTQLRERTELAFEIRELELGAQEETQAQEIALVMLQYEKKRNLILNEEAANTDLRKALKDNELKQIAEIEKKYRDQKKIADKQLADNEKRRAEEKRQTQKAALDNAVNNLAILASQDKKYSEIYKAAAMARTVISTYEGAQNAYTSLSKIPYVGVALGIAAAAAATAAGLARIQQINSQKFAGGGVVPGSGNRDTVPAMLTPGEVVLNREQQQRLLSGDIGGTRIDNVTINVSGSGSPQETATTIEETLYNMTEQSRRLQDVSA